MQKNFLLEALRVAKEALIDDEVPVGAVIIRDGIIIGIGKNSREKIKAHSVMQN